MRKTIEPSFLTDDSGKLVAVNLSADYCAEHEWGIKNLKTYYDIPQSKHEIMGIDAHRINRISADLKFVDAPNKFGGYSVIFSNYLYGQTAAQYIENHHEMQYAMGQPDKLIAAWDEGSFCVVAKTKQDRQHVETLYNAFLKKDIAIWVGGGGVFENAGLVIAIISNVSKKIKDEMIANSVASKKLHDDVEATGIEKKLADNNKKYYALSPRRMTKGADKRGSKHDIIFWLNPYEQNRNNFGWFTVEELTEWINNKGPIPKVKEDVG